MPPSSNLAAVQASHDGPIDYLIIGHVTIDLTPDGPRLGGTAAYASLTAAALGRRVGLVTACGSDADLSALSAIAIHRKPSPLTTTFRNITEHGSRRQILSARSDPLDLGDVPPAWRTAPLVHLAPVADELPPQLAAAFQETFVGVTPQGWWRSWDDAGNVQKVTADEGLARLPAAAEAAVFSRHDLAIGVGALEHMQRAFSTVAITDGARGADVYWDDQRVHVPAPSSPALEDTGAGDVFAAVFFIQLADGQLPASAAAEASRWASASVAHDGPDWFRAAGAAGFPTGASR